MLARVFPELATLAKRFAAAWVLALLSRYATPQRLARAQLTSLHKIPYLRRDQAAAVHEAARTSVGSCGGELAEVLVRQAVEQVRHSQAGERHLRRLPTPLCQPRASSICRPFRALVQPRPPS